MGLKITDVSPNAAYGPTAVTPPAKTVLTKTFLVDRVADASAGPSSNIKCILPADATVIDIRIFGLTASDAGTTATVQVGTRGASGARSNYGTGDVKANAGKIPFVATVSPTLTGNSIMTLEDTPMGGDKLITGNYIETGTVATTGGPWYVTVEYVR